MNRLELQSRALRGEIPLIPIGITHKEWTDKPAHDPRPQDGGSYYNNPSGYLPVQEIVTLEAPYDKNAAEVGPLSFAFLEWAPVCSPFFLVHFLQVGSSVLIDDVRGIHLQSFDSKRGRLAPARFAQGDKIILRVQNWDCANHCFYVTLYFAKDET